MDYIALIVDIEKSKGYQTTDRIEMQSFMNKCIGNLNSLFQEQMKFDVVFSAGDEIQGLFSDVTSAVLYFRLLELMMKPIKIRAGIGVGEWTVKLEEGVSTQQDGPTYHRARKAIEEVKIMKLHNIRICSDTEEDFSQEILVNHLLNASLPLKNQQIYMQNIVQVIFELLYPMIGDTAILYDYSVIKELICNKLEYRLGAKNGENYWERNKNLKKDRIGEGGIAQIKPIYINGDLVEVEEIMEKNVAVSISEILRCTRQNVDNIMRRGYVNKIRELDYVALQMTKKIYGRKKWNGWY